MNCPRGCPAVSSSGWRSHVRWSTRPQSCSPTSRQATWTARRPPASSICSTSCGPVGRPSCSSPTTRASPRAPTVPCACRTASSRASPTCARARPPPRCAPDSPAWRREVVTRLLLRGELRRGVGGHLVVVAILAGVAASLTLAAAIGRLAAAPWERTWRATGAAHLTLYAHHASDLTGVLARIPGLTAASGPIDTGFVGLHAGRWHVETRLEAHPAGGPGRPALVEGTARGLLLERSFARRLGVEPGDLVTFDAPGGPRAVRVTGLAVIADQELYPFGQPGVT